MITAALLLAAAVTGVFCLSNDEQHQPRSVESRHVFNPRMDYDEWKPLGRGDPLKNDPTYDYVPPVLERVHYWMDPSKRTPDPPLPNAGVMVLGARTEPPSTTVPATSRLGTMSLIDPFIKFMESSKASLGFNSPVSSFFRPTPNPPTYVQPTHNYVFYGPPHSPEPIRGQALQRPPYTMLMPPPLPSSTEPQLTSFGTTIRTTTEADEESTVETEEPTTTPSSTTVPTQTTHLANSENLYKPVAINMPESISNETYEFRPTTIRTPQEEEEEEEEDKLSFGTQFHENNNNLLYQELKLPSEIMIPPPEKSDDYFSFRPTTIKPTTTSRTLTTDPMFKHYKQPSEPIKGPFYLIIQGHSKVKTYGASKNLINAVSSNEINYEDGRTRDEDDDLASHESIRRERKLKFKDDVDDNNAEIVEGHPVIELSASFKTKAQAGFSVSDSDPNFEMLEDAFPKSGKGGSKKRYLANDYVNSTSRKRRYIGRSLLGVTSTERSKKDYLDKEQLGLESLIAISDDYNSEDVINLLLKQEDHGSGYGAFVSSLFSRSQKSSEDM